MRLSTDPHTLLPQPPPPVKKQEKKHTRKKDKNKKQTTTKQTSKGVLGYWAMSSDVLLRNAASR